MDVKNEKDNPLEKIKKHLSDSYRIRDHKYEEHLLKGVRFSDDIPNNSALIR